MTSVIVVKGPKEGTIVATKSSEGIDAAFSIALAPDSKDVYVLYRLRVTSPSIIVDKGYYGLLGADAEGKAAEALSHNNGLHMGVEMAEGKGPGPLMVEYVKITAKQAAGLKGRELNRDSCGSYFPKEPLRIRVPCVVSTGGCVCVKIAVGVVLLAAVGAAVYLGVKNADKIKSTIASLKPARAAAPAAAEPAASQPAAAAKPAKNPSAGTRARPPRN